MSTRRFWVSWVTYCFAVVFGVAAVCEMFAGPEAWDPWRIALYVFICDILVVLAFKFAGYKSWL